MSTETMSTAEIVERARQLGWPEWRIGLALRDGWAAAARLRRAGVVAIVYSGSAVLRRGCAGCGATHSESAKWRQTAHMRRFIAQHTAECGERLRAIAREAAAV